MSFMKVKLLGLHLKSRFYVNVYVFRFNRVLKSRAIYCCSVVKSCLTFCDPMDCSPPGFPFLHYLPETKARNKRHPHWKERSKMISVPNNMVLHVQNPKDFTRKNLYD